MKRKFRPHSSIEKQTNPMAYRGYTPQMMRKAYSFSPSFTGKGVRIAVICALDNVAINENLSVFCERFGLNKTIVNAVYPFGRAENTSDEWLAESGIDTQWAHVFAPDAELFAVFSPTAETAELLSAARYASQELSADIVSMSFGSEETAEDGRWADFFADGGSIFLASSGDVGGVPSFPSTSPFCISVGASSLFVSDGGGTVSETAWINSGGGASDIFDALTYQKMLAPVLQETNGKRATPDVAMSGDTSRGAAIYIAQLGGWTTAGGTSLSNACFAGVCACIKQAHPQIKTSEDMLTFLYSKAGGDTYSQPQYNFHDITIGKSGRYYAKSGWDFTSGLGSPVISQLVK